MEDLKITINKKTALQIAVKVVNNTANLDNLIPTLLIFEAYLCMNSMYLPATNIIK